MCVSGSQSVADSPVKSLLDYLTASGSPALPHSYCHLSSSNSELISPSRSVVPPGPAGSETLHSSQWWWIQHPSDLAAAGFLVRELGWQR